MYYKPEESLKIKSNTYLATQTHCNIPRYVPETNRNRSLAVKQALYIMKQNKNIRYLNRKSCLLKTTAKQAVVIRTNRIKCNPSVALAAPSLQRAVHKNFYQTIRRKSILICIVEQRNPLEAARRSREMEQQDEN